MGQGTADAVAESKKAHSAVNLRKTYISLVEDPPRLPLILSGLQPKTCFLATQHDAVIVDELARKNGVVHIGRQLDSATNRSTCDGVEFSTRLPARNELAKRNLAFRCLGILATGNQKSMIFYDQEAVSVMGFMKKKGAGPDVNGTRPRVPTRVIDRWQAENTARSFRGGIMVEDSTGNSTVLNITGDTDANGVQEVEAFELTYTVPGCPCLVKCRYSGQTKKLLEVTIAVKSAARRVQPSRYLLHEEGDLSPINKEWGLHVSEQNVQTATGIHPQVIVRQSSNDTVSVAPENGVVRVGQKIKICAHVVTWPSENMGIEEKVELEIDEHFPIDNPQVAALLDFQRWHVNSIPLEGIIEEVVGGISGPNGIHGYSEVVTTA